MRDHLHGVVVSILLLVTISASSQGSLPRAVDVRKALTEKLNVGDESLAIEQVLVSNSIQFTYDRFANRYQGIIRDPKSDAHAVVVYVNVDKERRFLSCETHDTYTMP